MGNRNLNRGKLLNYFEPAMVAMLVIILQLNLNPVLSTIVALFLVCYSLVNDVKKAMFVLLLIVPVATEIVFFGNISLTVAIAFLNAVKYCLFRGVPTKETNYKKKWGIFALVLLFYSIVVYGLIGTNEQLLYTVKLIAYLIFIERYMTDCKNKYKMRGNGIFSSVLRILGLGIIIASVCSIISGGQLSSAARFSFGDLAMANNTGIQSAFVAVGLLLARFLKNYRRIDYAIIISCCVIAIATQSRTAILMLGIATIIYIVSTIMKGRLAQAFFIILALTAGFIALLQIPTINSYYNSISNRFQVEDVSNGRYEIWGETIRQMRANKKYSLLGAGDYYNLDVTYGKRTESMVAHNFLIETWVIYGIIGSLLLFVLLWFYIKEVVFMNTLADTSQMRCLHVFVPIITLVLGLSFSHHFIGRANIILFVCSFIPISCTWLRKKNSTKVANNNEK